MPASGWRRGFEAKEDCGEPSQERVGMQLQISSFQPPTIMLSRRPRVFQGHSIEHQVCW